MLTHWFKEITGNFYNLKIDLNNNANKIAVAAGSLLVGFFVIRSIANNLEYDEAYTYMRYAQEFTGFLKIDLANNHPLNTFLIWLFSLNLPYNELLIRLPNILFGVLYVIVAINFASKFRSGYLITALLLFNFFVIHYFAMARGYGMSTALTLLGVWIILNKDEIKNYETKALYVFALSAFSYIGIIPLILVVGLEMLITAVKWRNSGFISRNILDLVAIGLFLNYLVYVLQQVSQPGKPVFGSSEPFLVATAGDVLNRFFGTEFPFDSPLLFYSVLAYLLVIAILHFKRFEGLRFNRILILAFALLYISTTSLGKLYPTERLLVPYWPIICLAVIELVELSLQSLPKLSRPAFRFLNYGFVALLGLSFFTQVQVIDPYFVSYTDKLYKQFDLDVSNYHDGEVNVFSFYRSKELHDKKLVSVFSKIEPTAQNVNGKIQMHYYKDQHVLVFSADTRPDKYERIFLRVYPKDVTVLAQDKQPQGFDDYELIWDDNGVNLFYAFQEKHYYFQEMPKYEIAKIESGQSHQKNVLWTESIAF